MDDEYEKSGITSHKDVKRFALGRDPSTVTVMGSENIGGGVETGSTGERDMHSDGTSVKRSSPQADGDVAKQEDGSSAIGREPDLTLAGRDNNDVIDGQLYGTDSTPASSSPTSGHASDFQSAEGLASDMPDRKGIHTPPSSGDRATDITGISYIQ